MALQIDLQLQSGDTFGGEIPREITKVTTETELTRFIFISKPNQGENAVLNSGGVEREEGGGDEAASTAHC
jgi:hypothetical protein